jgi:hypothetical protein
MSTSLADGGARTAHPAVFALLNVPFGAMSGYLGVTIAYLLSQGGVSAEEIAAVVAISYVPHTWKFAWAPLVDTTLTRKWWYVIGALLSAVGITAMGAPADAASISILAAVVFVRMATPSCAWSQLMAMPPTRPAKAGRLANGIAATEGARRRLWLTQDLPKRGWPARAWRSHACFAVCRWSSFPSSAASGTWPAS